jgi:hypothetical protein
MSRESRRRSEWLSQQGREPLRELAALSPGEHIARSLGLGIDPMSSEFHSSDERMASIDAASDLDALGLAEMQNETGGYDRIKFIHAATSRARPGHARLRNLK